MQPAALLDQVIEELYAQHTADAEAAASARREYEERRGKVHQDDELWEAWSAAFVEWFVVERVASGGNAPPAALTYRELAADDPRRDVVGALVTSQRSLFEIRDLVRGKVELLDLLGGAALLAYAVHKRDPVFAIGQLVGLLIYARNLGIRRGEEAADPRRIP